MTAKPGSAVTVLPRQCVAGDIEDRTLTGNQDQVLIGILVTSTGLTFSWCRRFTTCGSAQAQQKGMASDHHVSGLSIEIPGGGS